MKQPKNWAPEELNADAEVAKVNFRKQRLDEPLELYSKFFENFAPIFYELIERLPNLAADNFAADDLVDLFGNADARTAFRYLAAPPISEDDLKTLAETSLSVTNLRNDAEQARRVRDVVLHVIDPHRFPWMTGKRAPHENEKEQAAVASAAMVAARKVETARRKDATRVQEGKIKELLRGLGFEEVPRRTVALLDDAPEPGQFCAESKLGDKKADIIARLQDRRVMMIECKVSNSEVNSFKRVNHEAAGKAQHWLESFGRRAVVPAAVLAGVFKPDNLKTAQNDGLALFWEHRLKDLSDFVQSTAN